MEVLPDRIVAFIAAFSQEIGSGAFFFFTLATPEHIFLCGL